VLEDALMQTCYTAPALAFAFRDKATPAQPNELSDLSYLHRRAQNYVVPLWSCKDTSRFDMVCDEYKIER